MAFPTSYSDPYPDAGNSSTRSTYTAAAIGDVFVLFLGVVGGGALPTVSLGDETMTLLPGSVADNGYLSFGVYALVCEETHASGESINQDGAPPFFMGTITTPSGGTVTVDDLISAVATSDTGADSITVDTGDGAFCIWASGAVTSVSITPETGTDQCIPGTGLHSIGLAPDVGVGWSNGITTEQAATWVNGGDYWGAGIVAFPLSGNPQLEVDEAATGADTAAAPHASAAPADANSTTTETAKRGAASTDANSTTTEVGGTIHDATDSGAGLTIASLGTNVVADQNSNVTETAALVAGAPAGTDTGSGDDATVSAATATPATDAAAGAESPQIGLANADTGTGADQASLTATAPAADAGTGADVGAIRLSASPDSATGTDTAAQTTSAPTTDAATGADTPTLTAALTATDTGSGDDETNLTSSPRADAGQGADTATMTTAQATTDMGAAVDATTGGISPSTTDSGSSAEAAALSPITAAATETPSGTDSPALAFQAPVADPAATTDAATQVAALAPTETGAGADPGAVRVFVNLTDSGSIADALAAAALTPVAEPGTGADAASIATTQVDEQLSLGEHAHGADVVRVKRVGPPIAPGRITRPRAGSLVGGP